MYKQIFYDNTRDTKADKSLEISLLDDVLIKTAAEQPAYIKEWAETVQKEPGYAYIMVSAVGSGEVYGSNKNGDYFPEQALLSQQEADEVKPPATAPKIRYKTFEDAKFYRHHQNKPNDPSFGKIVGAFWDKKMHKVVLIVAVSEADAPDIVQEIKDGKIVAVSMGCKVPFDICSICGNKATKRSEYCSHLLSKMGQILEDGKKVYAINTKPRFFDLSYVTRPAWLGGWQIMKVASSDCSICSAEMAEINKTAYHDKNGEIFKSEEIPVLSVIRGASLREPTIPQHILDELSKYPKQMVWGAMVRLGIIPKPNEFSYLMLKDENPEAAEEALNKNMVFDPDVEAIDTDETDVCPTNLDHLFDMKTVNERSFWSPELDDRLGSYLVKESSFLLPIVIGLGLGALYKALRGKISWGVMGAGAVGTRAFQVGSDITSPVVGGTATPEEIEKIISGTYPGIQKEAKLKGQYLTAIGAFTAPYIYAAYAKSKGQDNILTRNPGKSGVAALGLLAMAKKAIIR